MSDPQFLLEFARRVRRRRQACGRTQRAVADEIEMAPPQYSKLEAGGIRLVDVEQLQKLATALTTSADYLLGLTEDAGDVPPEHCQAEALAVAGVTPQPAITLNEEGHHA